VCHALRSPYYLLRDDVDVLPLTREGQVIGTVMSDPQFQLEEFEAYLDPYRDGLPDDVERQVTARWAELFRIFYDRRDKIDRVTFWGAHDGMSWKNNYPVPGRMNYPLLFRRGGPNLIRSSRRPSRRPQPARFDCPCVSEADVPGS
jgi:hypothetical protein